MALVLRQEQRLEQRLELRLEQKQQLQLQLAQTLPEFSGLITFEDDNNLPLLEQSLPFMMYHEVSHPLHAEGYVQIPAVPALPSEQSIIDGVSVVSDYHHHAVEVGIDRAAYLVGQRRSRLYSPAELLWSHAALVERVVRDMLETKQINMNYPFLTRLQAELIDHEGLPDADHEVGSLRRQIDDHLRHLPEPEKKVAALMVNNYREIYRGTTITSRTG